ncbi:MAG: hypothetical protein RL684_1086, partial [Pseudomonadota bacterium]
FRAPYEHWSQHGHFASADRHQDTARTRAPAHRAVRRHGWLRRGSRRIDAKGTADELLVHSNEEQGHADRLAERIVQLGGEPDFTPDSHREMIQYLGDLDPTTSQPLKDLPDRKPAVAVSASGTG